MDNQVVISICPPMFLVVHKLDNLKQLFVTNKVVCVVTLTFNNIGCVGFEQIKLTC